MNFNKLKPYFQINKDGTIFNINQKYEQKNILEYIVSNNLFYNLNFDYEHIKYVIYNINLSTTELQNTLLELTIRNAQQNINIKEEDLTYLINKLNYNFHLDCRDENKPWWTDNIFFILLDFFYDKDNNFYSFNLLNYVFENIKLTKKEQEYLISDRFKESFNIFLEKRQSLIDKKILNDIINTEIINKKINKI